MLTELEEFKKLKTQFPKEGTDNGGNENCEWTDHMVDSKNCYWCFDGAEAQDCLYSYCDWRAVGCIDTLWNGICEFCYETSDSIESSNCNFSQYLARSYNMDYCFRCTDCHDCFGCVNLSNKDHCIFNVQYTDEEYDKKVLELKKEKPDVILAQVKEIGLKFPLIQSNFSDNTNSDYVDYVYNSQNSYYCFDSQRANDCYYLSNTNDCSDSVDCNMVNKLEHSLECVDCFECYNCSFCQDCSRCFDSAFLHLCVDCHNCFMCSHLAHAKFCILNVQYTQEEYEQKIKEIKNSLGLKFARATN